MVQLKIIGHDGKERIHELVDELTTVGRATFSTIQVTDEKASRQHFQIDKVGERYRLVDLGSTNGTRLNGVKLQGEVLLRPGDKIGLGRTIFIFDEANAPKGPPEAPGTATPEPMQAIPAAPTAPTIMSPSPVAEAPLAPPAASTLPAAAAADGPKYVLKVLEGPNAGQVYELGTQPVTMGRHASNTIHFADDAISSYHAEILKEPIGYVLSDLGSTNGTRVKPRQKFEFEKVVKTPLSAGMHIRLGKTTLAFVNIGKPVEDEALFGTVALEAEQLEAKLTERPRKVPMAALVALAVLVFIGVVAAVVYGLPAALTYIGKSAQPVPGKLPDKKADLENKIPNGDFSQGTDDQGNPKDFKLERGSPEVKAEVTPDADHGQDESKWGLRINKGGKSSSVLTAVETANSFALEPGKVYEFSGWMRNDGDGLFGLRVTWIQGERKFSENVVVLKDTQEWKEKTAILTPPPWAQRAKAGVFAQGKDGKACFDDLVFREKQGAAPVAAPSIRFGSVGIAFEGTKGMFTGTLAGEQVIEDGTLALVSRDGSAVSDLTSAVEPQLKAEKNAATFEGRLYDFALQDLTNYVIQARQAGQGVELKAAVDSPQEAASAPQLRFFIAGNVAQGDIEASKPGGGGVEKIAATEGNKSLSGIEEVLFNAGKAPQFDLFFSKPADVELKREGKRCGVTISFKGEMQIGLAPESVGQKRLMLAALADLKKSFELNRFGETEVKLKAFREAYVSRFPQAREEAARMQGQLDGEWNKMRDEVRNTMNIFARAPTPEAFDAANKQLNRYSEIWMGSERMDWMKEVKEQLEALRKSFANNIAEQQAEAAVKKAEEYNNNKVYTVARSLLQKVLKDYPDTKAAEKAKTMLPQVEAAERRLGEINSIQDRLRAKTKNYLLVPDYKSAINVIEKDKEYQDNRNDLKEINDLLADWRKKVPQ